VDFPATDRRFMGLALRLARRGLGRTAPNPAVGCLLVREGRVLARGWTQPGGRPHAETEALRRAGSAARGATAYVTLEPCAAQGVTPPCTQALIEAGVARTVVALSDPEPRTAGAGLAALRRAGIAVESGVLEDEAGELNRGFLLAVRQARPLVSLKLAVSLDGRIAARTGHSRWITGEAARRHGHLLRARHDAVLIGRGTLEADDPSLTCRVPGLETRSPLRVVLSASGALPSESRVFHDDGPPVWGLTASDGADRAAEAGVAPIAVDAGGANGVDLASALAELARRGVTRLLVEGGAATAAAFLRAGLVDQLYLYRAPMLIGGDGLAAVASLGVADVARDGLRLRHRQTRPLGGDALEVYVRGQG